MVIALRVLGVDPGLTRCGIGVIEGDIGRPLSLVAASVIRTDREASIGVRLVALEREIEQWLASYRPEAVAVERVFSQHNVTTAMGTAQAGAIAIVCAARRGLPVALHTPSEVKAAVTGNGRAGKEQVTQMVARLLKLADPPRPADAADALALAICHLWRGGAQQRLADAVAAARARQRGAGQTPGAGRTRGASQTPRPSQDPGAGQPGAGIGSGGMR
jgi:crossover junction endodeoxyribonuclease RuvC